VQALGRPTEVLVVDHGEERAQRPQLHSRRLSIASRSLLAFLNAVGLA
jgi:hypothetical protein